MSTSLPPSSFPPVTPARSAKAQSISGLTTALTVLFVIAAVVSVIGAGLAVSAVNDANNIVDGNRSSFGNLFLAEDGNGKMTGAATLWGLLALPILVILVIWTFRAHRNLKAFGADKPMLPTGMAIGSWFIPLFWYLGPYWCISDAYKGAAPDSGSNTEWRRSPSSGILLAWWVTFCLANVVFIAGSATGSSDGQGSFNDSSTNYLQDIVDDPERFAAGWTVTAVGYVIAVAAAILGAVAVRKVGARQEERIRSMATPR